MTATATRKLFGTDGIRAVAGETPLDPTTIFAVGLALAHSLKGMAAQPAVILGRDTRESSPWIAATIAAGLREAGARVESAGVVPTPAVAFLAARRGGTGDGRGNSLSRRQNLCAGPGGFADG